MEQSYLNLVSAVREVYKHFSGKHNQKTHSGQKRSHSEVVEEFKTKFPASVNIYNDRTRGTSVDLVFSELKKHANGFESADESSVVTDDGAAYTGYRMSKGGKFGVLRTEGTNFVVGAKTTNDLKDVLLKLRAEGLINANRNTYTEDVMLGKLARPFHLDDKFRSRR